MIDKVVDIHRALAPIKDGMTIMVGGSMSLGAPEILIDALVEKNVCDLTIICNDGGIPGKGVSKLIANGQVKKLIATHVGLNPEVTRRVNTEDEEEKMECLLVPQGTFAERIRAAGAGLGGILTPTGVGTLVAEGKRVIEVNGKEYLLEEPLYADVALIRASIADHYGNIVYKGTTRNQNPCMATAADYVVTAACQVVETGMLSPEDIGTPGIFINAVVGGEKEWQI